MLWQQQVQQVQLSEAMLDYLQGLIASSRDQQWVRQGLSPRGAMALVIMAKAWALIHARDYVIPSDVQAVFVPVCQHRLVPLPNYTIQQVLDLVLESVPAL